MPNAACVFREGWSGVSVGCQASKPVFNFSLLQKIWLFSGVLQEGLAVCPARRRSILLHHLLRLQFLASFRGPSVGLMTCQGTSSSCRAPRRQSCAWRKSPLNRRHLPLATCQTANVALSLVTVLLDSFLTLKLFAIPTATPARMLDVAESAVRCCRSAGTRSWQVC